MGIRFEHHQIPSTRKEQTMNLIQKHLKHSIDFVGSRIDLDTDFVTERTDY
jgi:hypothetical protein